MTEQLVSDIQRGRDDLRPVLWEKILPFIYWNIHLFKTSVDIARYGLDDDDLAQCAYIAMNNALKDYDRDKASFTTHLKTHIRAQFYEAIGKTEKKHQDPINRCTSLDTPVFPDDPDGPSLLDTVPDPHDDIQDVEDAIYNEQLHAALNDVLRKCPDEEAEALRSIYLKDRSRAETASAMGVTVDTVKRLQNSGLRHLRQRRRELEQFIDYNTPFYLTVGVSTFARTHESAVEKLASMREHIARQAPIDL